MTRSFALLCPGQGTQHAAMFDLARSDPRAASMLQQWSLDTQLGMPVEQVLHDPQLLYANRMAQPLLVAAALAMWAALRDDLPAPALVAGYSIGELSAYGVAAALDPADAVRLAALRAGMMNDCLQNTPRQALAALSGILISSAGALLNDHGFQLAIQTGDDSAIVGGPVALLPGLQAAISASGGRLGQLPVEVAAHTPYMGAAVAPFERALRQCRWAPPAIPVLAGISGNRITAIEQATATLSRQVAEPIRWMDCMDACAESGITVALELGPGSSLSRMLQARHPAIACRSVADFRTLAGVRQWLSRSVAE